MGIPGFFGFIKKYNDHYDIKIIKKCIEELKTNLDENKEEIVVDTNFHKHLFLDFNGAIYTAYHKNKVDTIDALVANTIGYLDVLCSIHSDLETIYIAIDGSPPRAKAEQQRTRRFHSKDEKNTLLRLNEKFATETEKITKEDGGLDTNMITPGTPFMYKLCLEIKNHIKTSPIYANKKVIFSGADVPLEGEHKILHYIKQNTWQPDDMILIYGLDADLIMLSIASHVNSIYLLREKTEYGQYSFDFEGYHFLYLDIDSLKFCLMKEFEDFIGEMDAEEIVPFMDDYVFLCFILGNDFVPKIPWLNFKNKGHDKLLDAYFQVYNLHREHLVNTTTMKINQHLLYYIFEKLAENETFEMRQYHKIRAKKRIYMRDVKTEYEKQKMLMTYFPLRHLDVEEVIDPERPGWRSRYYKTCLHMFASEDNVEFVVQRYIESLIWTFKYYFDEIPSWGWYYPYHYAPTALDVVNYMDKILIKGGYNGLKNINNLRFTKGQPIKPQELLVMVLPYSSRSFMAREISGKISDSDNPLSVYFPKRYNISIPYHTFYWECRPIVPLVNYNIVKAEMKNCKLTKEEIERNKFGEPFIIEN